MQMSFDPLKYQDAGLDEKAARLAAMRARNLKAKEMRAEGARVHCWTLTGQLRQYAGLGVPDGRVRNVFYISA